jgi:hypothetical protein
MDDAEAAAIGQGFATIYSATKSRPGEQATGLREADLGEIMAWIRSPGTGSLDVMLADAGRCAADAGRCAAVAGRPAGSRRDRTSREQRALRTDRSCARIARVPWTPGRNVPTCSR